MDQNQTYLDMFNAMVSGDFKQARELALALQACAPKLGYYPHRLSPEGVTKYVDYVLQRTANLDAPPVIEPRFYVICPECNCRVEIPADAVGPERTDLWNVVECDACEVIFDYDDQEVLPWNDVVAD